MKTRIITALVGLLIVIPVLWFSNTVALEIFISIISIIAVYEMLHCIGVEKNFAVLIPAELIAAVFPFLIRVVNTEKSFGMSYCGTFICASFILMMLIMALSVFSEGKLAVDNASLVFMTVLYITFGFSGIVSARNFEGGKYLYLLVFLAAWIPDTGAYFVGVKLGKHKLIPDVSPKKTVEGAIGGLITCMAAFAVYTVCVNSIFDAKLNIWLMLIASVILCVVSMVGDLIASLIKRHYDIKDYGNLLPGHGGIMDRFDSVLAVSCVMNVLWLMPVFANNVIS